MEKVSKYFKFPSYDIEDIKQEGRIIGLSKLQKYTEDRGDLENFLFVSISNGLRNLIKKHYYDYDRDNGGVNSSRKKINWAIGNLDSLHYSEDFDFMAGQEIVDKTIRYLHPEYRKDFKRMLEGHSVKTIRKARIIQEVRRIYFLLLLDQERVLKDEDR